MKISFWLNDEEHKLDIKESSRDDMVQVELGGALYQVSAQLLCPDKILLNINGRIYDVYINANSRHFSVGVGGKYFRIERQSAAHILGKSFSRQGKREVKTSMPGKIVALLAAEGDDVETGQAVLILEAMKMQNEIKSPISGRIKMIKPGTGDSVETGGLLFIVE
jgi:acetyl/propionyl-CoA carboxylase alpha subunit